MWLLWEVVVCFLMSLFPFALTERKKSDTNLRAGDVMYAMGFLRLVTNSMD